MPRAAFVTGASYGIGAACALALARDGFHAAVSELDPKNLADTVAKITAIGVRALPVALDLRSLGSIEQEPVGVFRGAPRLCRGATSVAVRGEPRSGGEPSPSVIENGLGGPVARPPMSSNQPGSFQPSQLQRARPMISSLSFADSHGSSSVNIVTHCRHEHGMRVMSVPQNIRSGPKAS